MKIAIIVFQFLPKWVGGTEIATFNLAKHLAKKGHDVHIITRGIDTVPNFSLENGLKIHRLKITKIKYALYLDFWIKSLCFLKKVNPDIMHFQSILMPSFIMKKILKTPTVISGQGSDLYLKSSILNCLYKKMIRLNLKQANAVIVLTEHMKKDVLKIHDRKVHVIPNCIKLEKFDKHLHKKKIRRLLSFEDNMEYIIYVGGLREVKGLKYLILAFRILKDHIQNIKLIVIGDGKLRKSLEDLTEKLDLKDSVIFLGKIDNENIPIYLISSDVFVLPSLSEGFPNVLLEAMAAGLPIITTNVKGIPEIIVNKKNGFLVEPKNPQQIATNILKILKDKELSSEISKNNLKKVKVKYEQKEVFNQIENIYSKIMKD